MFIAVIFTSDPKLKPVKSANFTNSTFNYGVCGKNFCPSSSLPPAASPSLSKVINSNKY